MSNFKLPTTEEKFDYVHRQFERVAARYDLANDVISMGMHRLWKRQAVSKLSLEPGKEYLDICCGTGDLALFLAETGGADVRVTGLDFSANMLSIARQREVARRRQNNKLASLTWVEGDALHLPFADDSFSGSIISFGLRNLIDYPKSIKEMCRVVKPQGKVVILDLGRATLPIFKEVFHLYFRYLVPVLGEIIQGDRQSYTYLPESIKFYPQPRELTAIMEESGLQGVKHYSLAFGSVALHVGHVP